MSIPLPDEILIEFFSYLEEVDLVYCMKVCKSWYNVANDLSLLYISSIFVKTLSFETLLVTCCERNHVLSFDKALRKLNEIFPQIRYVDLWNNCINIACRKGYLSLFKKLHNFATYDHTSLIKLASENGNSQIVNFLNLNTEPSSGLRIM